MVGFDRQRSIPAPATVTLTGDVGLPAKAAGLPSAKAGGQVADVLGPAEFAERFQRSFRILWCVAAGLVNDRSFADDVVQEAALVALSKLDQFRPGTNFTAWMAQMVRFVALNQVRKQENRMHTAVDPSRLDSTRSTQEEHRSPLRLTSDLDLPDDQIAFDDLIVQALASVNPTARACLLLKTIEGLEYREIARVLDIPEGTAMSHVHRTRLALRAQIAEAREADDGRRRLAKDGHD